MSLEQIDWAVRTEVYRIFAERGSAPSIAELAVAVGGTTSRVRAALHSLFDAHELALDPTGDVWMAHPFSAVPSDYRVQISDLLCYANCAWDALGVPAILGTDGWTRTHCAESGAALEFGIRGGQIEGDAGVIHFVTPPRDAWVDIGFT